MWIHFAGLAKVYKKKRFTATPTMRLWQYQPQKWHASRKSGRAMWEWRVKIAKHCLITACWKLDYSIMLKFTLKAHNHVWYWYQYKVTGSENLANSWNPGRSQSQCIWNWRFRNSQHNSLYDGNDGLATITKAKRKSENSPLQRQKPHTVTKTTSTETPHSYKCKTLRQQG